MARSLAREMTSITRHNGLEAHFRIVDPHDAIQQRLQSGSFYEIDQLVQHRNLIAHGSSVLDIGANVGNHAVFYAMHTAASAVYCFETEPEMQRMLRENVCQNNLNGRVNFKYVDATLGVTALDRFRMALDEIVVSAPVSFVKLDVPDSPMAVLAGGEAFLHQHRPSIAIAVHWRHDTAFWAWCKRCGYQVINIFREIMDSKTYLLIPQGGYASSLT